MYGQNPVAGSRIASEGFRVHSIFYTIQGEGPFVGTPAIFVRLSDCNLRCFWCDTAFEDGNDMTANELAGAISKLATLNRCRFIVITGGEPMLQPLKELIDHPVMVGYSFQLETSGSYWPIGGLTTHGTTSADRLSIVCSPKMPNIVPMLRHHETFSVYWKYIVRVSEPVAEDGLPAMATQTHTKGRPARLFRPITLNKPKTRARVYVQGCDEGDTIATRSNVEYASTIALTFGYHLSIQTHKILGLD